MADQEIEHRLTSTVSGLRRGIASTRDLHATLRSEAKALNNFIPMLVEGARSGITTLLKHQASLQLLQSHACARGQLPFEGSVKIWVTVSATFVRIQLPFVC